MIWSFKCVGDLVLGIYVLVLFGFEIQIQIFHSWFQVMIEQVIIINVRFFQSLLVFSLFVLSNILVLFWYKFVLIPTWCVTHLLRITCVYYIYIYIYMWIAFVSYNCKAVIDCDICYFFWVFILLLQLKIYSVPGHFFISVLYKNLIGTFCEAH